MWCSKDRTPVTQCCSCQKRKSSSDSTRDQWGRSLYTVLPNKWARLLRWVHMGMLSPPLKGKLLRRSVKRHYWYLSQSVLDQILWRTDHSCLGCYKLRRSDLLMNYILESEKGVSLWGCGPLTHCFWFIDGLEILLELRPLWIQRESVPLSSVSWGWSHMNCL